MHLYEVGERAGLHLLHDPRAVNLHRTLTDTEFVRDDLVGLARHDQIEHLTLAIGQSSNPLRNFRVLLALFPALPVRLQRLTDAIEQVLP